MQSARWLLDQCRPGGLVMVIGRPATGVTSLLDEVAVHASRDRPHVVLASWERRPDRDPEEVTTSPIGRPEIINWDLGELARCRELVGSPEGTVLVVDYAQLVNHPEGDSGVARDLRALAQTHRWSVVLGVMAPRELELLDHDAPDRIALDHILRVLDATVEPADALVLCLGQGEGARQACATRTVEQRWSLVRG